MASSLVEQTRSLHAERALHKDIIVFELLNQQKGHRQKIEQQHEIHERLKKIQEAEAALIKVYEDKDNSRSKELRSMSGNRLKTFYDKLTEIRNYHKRFPMEAEDMEISADMEIPINTKWTGEEYYGKFVDMHELYTRFINMSQFDTIIPKTGAKIDYKTFLKTFHYFHNVEKDTKDEEYLKFLKEIAEYLLSVFTRRHPLYDANRMTDKINSDFDSRWNEGKVEGWQVPYSKEIFEKCPSLAEQEKRKDEERKKKEQEAADKKKKKENAKNDGAATPGQQTPGGGDATPGNATPGHATPGHATPGHTTPGHQTPGHQTPGQQTPNRQDDSSNAMDTSDDTSEKKESEEDSPFYCKVCKKLFKDTVFPNHLKGKKHKKKQKLADARKLIAKDIALVEFLINTLVQVLADVLRETCEYIEKKQTRTWQEILAELEIDTVGEDDDLDYMSDDENYTGGVYNPLNIPTGWDGKPIPYWLYKFHGLNLEFKCEICGNHSYWGPRAFNRHFREWRHAHGMRTIGVPNTKHFHNITKITDAQELQEKLKKQKKSDVFDPNVEEEFEDQEGHVFGKQTYEALKRQGVI